MYAYYVIDSCIFKPCTLNLLVQKPLRPNPNQVPINSRTRLFPSGLGLTLNSSPCLSNGSDDERWLCSVPDNRKYSVSLE